MYRVQLLGKVGYFEKETEVYNFAVQQIAKTDFDIILKDLRMGTEKIKGDFLNLMLFNSKRLIGRNKMIFKNNVGVHVANYFMNFRYKLKAFKKRSIEENLKDKESLKRVVNKIITLNRPIYANGGKSNL